MRTPLGSRLTAILIVVACLLRGCLSSALEDDEDDYSELDGDFSLSGYELEAQTEQQGGSTASEKRTRELLENIRDYEVCNVRSFRELGDGRTVVLFDSDCNRGTDLQQLATLPCRGIVQDVSSCILALLQQIINLKFGLPAECCNFSSFPGLAPLFSLFCSNQTPRPNPGPSPPRPTLPPPRPPLPDNPPSRPPSPSNSPMRPTSPSQNPNPQRTTRLPDY